jgi:tetratricopeptide (TPR) repeat protein
VEGGPAPTRVPAVCGGSACRWEGSIYVADCYAWRGYALFLLGRHAEAEADFGAALVVDPENAYTYVLRAKTARWIHLVLTAKAIVLGSIPLYRPAVIADRHPQQHG